MTEKMNYKHSEVLSAVLTNRACHTLAVYFLLNKKMKRLSKEYRVSLFSNTRIRTFVKTLGEPKQQRGIFTHAYYVNIFCCITVLEQRVFIKAVFMYLGDAVPGEKKGGKTKK